MMSHQARLMLLIQQKITQRMMGMIKRIVTVFLLFIYPTLLFCQEKDFGIWYNLNSEIGLTKKLNLEMSVTVRTVNRASDIDEGFGEIGLSWDLLKFLSLAGSYRLTDKLEGDSKYHVRHKWLADLKGNGDIGNFSFSGRLRFQRQDKMYIEKPDDEIPDYYGRIKFKTKYNIKSFPLDPYMSVETFIRMFAASEKRFDKLRISLGTEYKINKKNSVDLAYLFQRDYLPNLSDINIISVGYNLKF
jgi:hypothetical protein